MRIATRLAALAAMIGGTAVLADEGMWTFDNLPLKALKEQYGFVPPAGWADHLRSAAVRFNNGGSGSFVSADGLIMTNHHVGADTLQKLSTAEKNLLETGFLAKTRDDEPKAPDLELNVLVGIEDVTDRVTAGVNPQMPDAEAAKKRRANMAAIEKESTEKTGLRSDVVTLYQGGKYALYTYKKYTDIRLVFAPEFEIAFFGGDPDNFEFPRYDLDVCFFRAYEDGKPAKIEHFLKWSADGSKDGDLIFVAGHPGRTNRLNTLAHLEYIRDEAMPFLLKYLKLREADCLEYGKRGEEQERQAKEDLFSIQNSLKARTGGLNGLKGESLLPRKAEAEKKLRANIEADPRKKEAYGAAWDKIAQAEKTAARTLLDYSLFERGFGFDSTLFSYARTLIRLAEEDTKPNEDRLREYRDSNRNSLELGLFSTAPIYPEYEAFKLAKSFESLEQALGADNPLVRRVLDGKSPVSRAEELVKGSKLADVAYRKELAKGGKGVIDKCDDPMIVLAKLVDPQARDVRKIREDEVEGVEASQYALIAKAIFEELGDSVYPDATFTLRLAYGTVKGYEQDGKRIAPYTNIAGAFEHEKAHGAIPPYKLPKSWHEAKDSGKLHLETPLDFVSTADIIGGNSGSPVVNRDNEVVGLIFDGNIHSLVLDYAFDDKQARAVSVDSRAIVEALRSVYAAEDLAKELTGK